MHFPVTLEPRNCTSNSVDGGYKTSDTQKAADLTHQGGATCKFSEQFTVALVRTKKSSIYLQESNRIDHFGSFSLRKYTNENAEHSRPLLCTVQSQNEGDFCRLLVAPGRSVRAGPKGPQAAHAPEPRPEFFLIFGSVVPQTIQDSSRSGLSVSRSIQKVYMFIS